jgi:hypothetical protein
MAAINIGIISPEIRRRVISKKNNMLHEYPDKMLPQRQTFTGDFGQSEVYLPVDLVDYHLPIEDLSIDSRDTAISLKHDLSYEYPDNDTLQSLDSVDAELDSELMRYHYALSMLSEPYIEDAIDNKFNLSKEYPDRDTEQPTDMLAEQDIYRDDILQNYNDEALVYNEEYKNRLYSERLGFSYEYWDRSLIDLNYYITEENLYDRTDQPTGYHERILPYTDKVNAAKGGDGYVGNVRRQFYPKTWDKLRENVHISSVYDNIDNPSVDLWELWNDPERNRYNNYLEYVNGTFGNLTGAINVIGGIVSGKGGFGLSLGNGDISVVSDFNVANTLAGRIYSTATGKDTPLGRFGMKAAAISMANSAMKKTQKEIGNVVGDFLEKGINKILGKKTQEDEGTKEITNPPGVWDDIMNRSGLGGVVGTIAGGLGLDNIFGKKGNGWSPATAQHPNYVWVEEGIFNLDFEYKPNIELFTEESQLKRIKEYNKKTGEPIYDDNVAKNEVNSSELLNKWTGKFIKNKITKLLDKNLYQPPLNDKDETTYPYPKSTNEKFKISDKHTVKYNEGTNSKIYFIWDEKNVFNRDENSNEPPKNDDTFEPPEKINIKQASSLLEKTQYLFEKGKIETIISSFCTGNKTDITSSDSAYREGFGRPKGRNLLKKETKDGDPNPYCRAWTWDKQYRGVSDAIRPLKSDTGNFLELKDYHEHSPYRPVEHLNNFTYNSVLMDNGLVRIGANHKVKKNKSGKNWIDEKIGNEYRGFKKYFFSIENLAWKGLNLDNTINGTNIPYSNYEQNGLKGGRLYWFAPLNLTFQDNTSTSLNREDLIGRGEPVITYINTVRSGNMSFTMLVDHSSYQEYVTKKKFADNPEDFEQYMLRWEAGCETPKFESITTSESCPTSTEETKPTINEPASKYDTTNDETSYVIVGIFFPNDYSGVDDNRNGLDAMRYIYEGHGNNITNSGGRGYEMKVGDYTSSLSGLGDSYKCGHNFGSGGAKFLEDNVDKMTATDSLSKGGYPARTTSGGKVGPPPSRREFLPSIGYSSTLSYFDVNDFGLNVTPIDTGSKDCRSFKDFYDECMAYYNKTGAKDVEVSAGSTLAANKRYRVLATDDGGSYVECDGVKYYNKMRIDGNGKTFTVAGTGTKLFEDNIKFMFEDADSIESEGFASNNGIDDNNSKLAKYRNESVRKFIQTTLGLSDLSGKWTGASKTKNRYSASATELKCASSKGTKQQRHVILTIKMKTAKYEALPETTPLEKDNKSSNQVNEANQNPTPAPCTRIVTPKYRYDDEEDFYKYIDENSDLTYTNFRDRYDRFIPCRWSCTPEGFNARLNFLQQCTRQGPTQSGGGGAENLAFGRPPVCILRIGDFIQSRIYIESLSIDYRSGNGIQWDLNPEGIGVQPMIATVNISFIYMGGQDLSGPISRLQNAVSFNHYANTSVYDDRADIENNIKDSIKAK